MSQPIAFLLTKPNPQEKPQPSSEQMRSDLEHLKGSLWVDTVGSGGGICVEGFRVSGLGVLEMGLDDN